MSVCTYLAQCARVADGTDALVLAHQVHALAAVATRRTRALVDVDFAVAAWVEWGTENEREH